jgi:DNA-binding NarL/FixJ family response regulator
MIRILIVDQVRLTGTVIGAVLQQEPDVHVVGQATTLDEVLELAPQCDLLVVNSLTGNGIVDLTRSVSRVNPEAKVVVVGLPDIKEVIVQHVEAGIAGYVLREESVEHLVQIIRAVKRGEAVVSPDVAAALMARIAQLANLCQDTWTDPTPFTDLTPREREVLALVHQGLSNHEIATELTIELGTVKNHIHNILRKLNVRSRHDAVAYLLMARDEPMDLVGVAQRDEPYRL